MAKKTTVDLTDYGQKVKDRLVFYGLRNILSAGLVLLETLPSDDREALIRLIDSGADAQIQAFATELCGRCIAAKQQRTPAKHSAKVG